MDGVCVTVPVFVQPDSEQACLLGMNVIPHLGIKLVRANGKPLIPTPSTESEVSQVRLIDAVTLPSKKGRFLQAEVVGGLGTGDILFDLDMMCWSLLG